MSHFYGMIPTSARKTVPTARGHKHTGLVTIAASYQGAVEVHLWHNTSTGKDHYEVHQKPWEGSGITKIVAQGILGE